MKQYYAQRNASSRYAWIMSVIVLLIMTGVGFAYKDTEHTDIGQHATNNYMTYVRANPDTCVGTNALAVYGADIMNTIVSEDDSNPYGDAAPYLRHFYDPITGNGLLWIGRRYPSALERATAYWNDFVIPNYKNGNYHAAYLALGRVMHLVMDMGVPAHVNLDPHAVSDYYESTYVRTPANRVHTTTILTANDLTAIMNTLANISRGFDSDDVNGRIDEGIRRDTDHNGMNDFSPAEAAGVAQVCYPGAENAAGGVLRLFYDTVKPEVQLARPASGEIHTGINDVPFEAKAKSYGMQFELEYFIKEVNFDYAEIDNPSVNDWTRAGSAAIFDENYKYIFNWNNNIDDDKVWVRATAIDNGDCDSLRVKTWIKIDSTRPKVSNTKP